MESKSAVRTIFFSIISRYAKLCSLRGFCFCILVLLGLFSFHKTESATITWDGGGADNNWSTCANWTTDTCPGTADIATFNTTSTKDATIDASFAGSVAGINIATGYSGTITQSRSLTIGTSHFTQAAGTFSMGSQSMTVNGGNFAKTGGTFDAGTGTVTFSGGNSMTYSSNSTESFYNLTINKSSSQWSLSGTTITVNGTLTLTSGFVDNGTINAHGNIIQGSSMAGRTATLNFANDAVAQTYTIAGGTTPTIKFDSAADANDSIILNGATIFYGLNITSGFSGTVPITYNNNALTIDSNGYTQAAGTFIAPTSLTLSTAGFTKTGGTFDEGTGTIIFTGSNASYSSDVTESFYNFTANKNGNTLSVTGTINITNTLTLTDGLINSGTLNAKGNISQSSTFDGGNAILNFADDSVAQTYTTSGGIGPLLTLDSAADANDSIVLNSATTYYGLNITSGFSGTVPFTYNGNAMTLGIGGYTQGAGTFIAPTTLTVQAAFTKTAGTFDEGSGTVIFAPASNRTYDVATSETFNNVTLNTTSGSLSLSSDTLIATGNLVLTNGTINTGTIEVQGNVTVASTFDSGSAVLKFTGSGTQTFDLTGATALYDGDISVDKTGGKVNLNSALTLNAASQDLTLIEGIFNLNGNALTVNGTSGTFTAQDGTTLELQGGETITANTNYPTFASGSTVKYSGTSGPYTIKSYAYHHLTIDGSGATFNLPATTDVNGNLTITAGTLDATASNFGMTVAGNWSNSGTFTPRSGTVTFDGTNQSISGSTSFYNFTKTESTNNTTDSILTFGNTGMQTISGTLTLDGLDSDDRINLVSDSPGTRWELAATGAFAIDYVDVTDSDASGGSAVTHTNTIDGGNNINWGFNNTPTVSSLGPTAFVDGSWGTDSTPTVTFTTADGDGDNVTYHIQIDDSSNFGSPIVDYTSVSATVGASLFTVGQATGGGSYSVGSSGQTLSDGSYYWRVQTSDGTDTSSYSTANSGSIAFKIDTTAPTPGTISFGTVTATSVVINTTAGSDSGSSLATAPYQFRNTTASIYSGAQTPTTWTNSGLTPNTAYTYEVGVYDTVGNAATSSTASTRTLANVPTNLVLTVDSSSQITATWGANSNPAGTEYYVENTTAGTNSGWITATTWTSTGLSSGTTYTFTVKARNADNTQTATISQQSTTDNNTPTVSSLGPTSYVDGSWITDTTPTLTFTTSDADGDTVAYELELDDSSDFSSPIITTTSAYGAAGAVTYTVGSPLSDSAGYYWRVRVGDGIATSSYAAANSGSIAFKIDTVAPTSGDISFGTITATSIVVNTSAGSDATAGLATAPYQFFNSTAAVYSGAQTPTTWTSTGLTPETEYTFVVVVMDAAGNIATSTATSTYTLANTSTPGNTSSGTTANNGIAPLSSMGYYLPLINPLTLPTQSPVFGGSLIPHLTKNLQLNTIDAEVLILQKFLNNIGVKVASTGAGSPGKETNKFGALTLQAVKRFQCQHRIICSGASVSGYGIVGPRTRARINQMLQNIGI